MLNESTALSRLTRLSQASSLSAAVLALLVPPGSSVMAEAWRQEVALLQGLAPEEGLALRHDAAALSSRVRLPCLEDLLGRLAGGSHAERRTFLESARRLLSAQQHHGLPARPIDRLHWLLLRHKLGEPLPPAMAGTFDALAQLPEGTRQALTRITAFLSRLVPADEAAGVSASVRQAWYQAAVSRWTLMTDIPPCAPPDGVELAYALQDAQSLPWMLRPALVRAWVDAASGQGGALRMSSAAADALRLCARLLDSPLPPGLAHYFDELKR